MSSPDLFTVTEAAVVLRIGRTTAYELVRRDVESGGGEGLDAVRIGGQFRVPRASLERIIGGPVTWPGHEELAAVEAGSSAPPADPPHGALRPARPVDRGRGGDEPTLPFPC